MKKIYLSLFITAILSFSASAQQAIQWQKSLGGTLDDRAYSVQQTLDSGFVVAGYTNSVNGDVTGNHGGGDYWVVKLNTLGNFSWKTCLGGSGVDQAYSIQQTMDSGYIVAGYSNSNNGNVSGNHGGYDAWVVKLNQAGGISWQISLGGTGDDRSNAVWQTLDSGYVIACETSSNDGDVSGNHGQYDSWIVKLTPSGVIEWKKILGGTEDDKANALQQTVDSGFIIAGESESNDGDVTGNHGGFDYWVVKLNKDGNTIDWQRSLGGSSGDRANSVQQTTDSGYVIGGYSSSQNGDVTGNHPVSGDCWIAKLNKTGTVLQWQRSMGGTGADYVGAVRQLMDGSYLIGGYTNSTDYDVHNNHGLYDCWMVCLTPSGAPRWTQCLGGTGNDRIYAVQQTGDQGYIYAGYSDSNDGDVSGNHDTLDVWVVRINPFILGQTELNNPSVEFQLHPNPATDVAAIVFELLQPEHIIADVYDMTGRLMKNLVNEKLPAGHHEINLDISTEKIVPGMYFVNFKGERFSKTMKMIVVE